MIPTIEDILARLLSGEYTMGEALLWIDAHMRSNADRVTAAMFAMQGLCAAGPDAGKFTSEGLSNYAKWTTEAAVKIADALLAELAKEVK